jgi:hypothetical protein
MDGVLLPERHHPRDDFRLSGITLIDPPITIVLDDEEATGSSHRPF